MRTFYEVMTDVYIPGRWYLGNPSDVHGNIIYKWTFADGKYHHVDERIIIPLEQPGRPLDFDDCGVGAVVLHARVVKLLQELEVPDLQFIPVTVAGQPDEYSIMNVTRLIPCVDEARCSRVERWKPEDGRPDRVGEYHVIEDLRIDLTKVGDARIFRPWGWPVLIVSNDIKEAFEHAQLLGPKYIPV